MRGKASSGSSAGRGRRGLEPPLSRLAWRSATWTFARIAESALVAATCRLDRWRERGGLLVWEAFVTGVAKLKTHDDDAGTALDVFMARWPDLRSDIPPEPALNLAIASAMSADSLVQLDELGSAAIVIAAT